MTPRGAYGADFVIAGLRRMVGVDVDAFSERFATPIGEALPVVDDLMGEGLLERIGHRIRLTDRGARFADDVGA